MKHLLSAPLLLLLAGLAQTPAPATPPSPSAPSTPSAPATPSAPPPASTPASPSPSAVPSTLPTPSPAYLALVPDPAALVKLSGGYRFLEGPTWLPAAGELVFSDIPADTQYAYAPASQPTTRVYRKPSGNANGTALLPDGDLLVCRHGPRDVVRVSPSGTLTVLATHFEGEGRRRLNSPNDAVVAPDGTVFFTDPPWGVKKDARELDFCGVYVLPPGGQPALLSRDLLAPNGIALSPDGSTLYVTESSPQVKTKFINAYPLTKGASGWTAGPARRFYTVDKGTPDGIRVDVSGNLWTTAGDGVHVVAPDGSLLGRILTPESPANLTFGGPDGRTLFITARTSLYAIPTSTTGITPTK